MRFLAALARLDRRWIFLGLGLSVLVPVLFPLPLALAVTPRVRNFVHAVDAIPDGSAVLMSCDYDPAFIPEMVPMTRTVFRHLLSKDCRVVVTVLWSGGPALVDSVLSAVAREFAGKRYGVDWVDLGYRPGNEAIMVLMGRSIASAFPRDYHGTDVHRLPLMRRVRDYSSFPLLVSLSAGTPGTREWVQQVQGRFHLPVVAGVTAASAPDLYPYLQAGQLRGLLAGMVAAAEYEAARGERGTASRGMGAQAVGHVFVALCLVLGGLAQMATRRTP
jgi:hypothetical protein